MQFVARESAGLAAAVRVPRDPAAVRNALGWHEESHRPWLSLLATCRRAGWSSTHELTRLYGYHGRLVELLERGLVADAHTAAVLARHLRTLTREAVDGLHADAASHAHHGCPRVAHRPSPPAGAASATDD